MDPSIASSSSSVISIPKKKRGGTGRKKITIKKIEKPEYRRVTFSKRRNGVFNRAKELVALCGAEVAVITFSQGGKVFGFANKSADSIVDRFLQSQQHTTKDQQEEDHAPPPAAAVVQVGAAINNDNNPSAAAAEQDMQIVSDTAKMVKWLDAPISRMGLEELEKRKMALESMIQKVRTRRLKAKLNVWDSLSRLNVWDLGESPENHLRQY